MTTSDISCQHCGTPYLAAPMTTRSPARNGVEGTRIAHETETSTQ